MEGAAGRYGRRLFLAEFTFPKVVTAKNRSIY